MSYEDTIRVAALKTRGARFERVRDEVRARRRPGAGDRRVPASARAGDRRDAAGADSAAGSSGPGWARDLVERWTTKGRVVHDQLARAATCCSTRRRPARLRRTTHALRGRERRDRGVARAKSRDGAALNHALAVEVARCQRLVKGYSDTHERGVRNFDAVMAAVQRAGAALAPATPARAARGRARRRARRRTAGDAGAARARLTSELPETSSMTSSYRATRRPIARAGAAGPRAPRPLHRPGDVRARAGALLRQHLELRRPRQPDAASPGDYVRTRSPAGR